MQIYNKMSSPQKYGRKNLVPFSPLASQKITFRHKMASILQVFLYLCVILLVKTIFKMKKLTFSIMIALMALTALNANARMPRQERGVLYTKLINLLATSGQWDEQNLTDIGLKTLFSEAEED